MSPRPGPRRPKLAVRVATAGLEWIDEKAARRGVKRSQMVRVMLAYARQHMPAGWEPGQGQR